MQRRLDKQHTLRNLCSISLLAGLLLIVCAVGFGQEGGAVPKIGDNRRAEIALQIRQAVEELQAVRQQQRLAAKQHRDRLSAIERQLNSLRGSLESVEKSVSDERAEIEKLESDIAKNQKSAQASKAWIKAVAAIAKPVAERTRARIQQSAGDQKTRRLSAVERALDDINADDSSRQLDGVRSLLNTFGEEWTAAKTVTLTNKPVLLNNDQQLEHAWVVGFGLAAKAFVSEDGSVVGIWSANNWQLELPQETRDQLIKLMSIVREKLPPSVTPVPVIVNEAAK